METLENNSLSLRVYLLKRNMYVYYICVLFIIGSFLNFLNNDLLPALEQPGHVIKKKKPKHTLKVVNKNRDIREMLKKYK